MTRAIGAGDRATASAQQVNYYAAVWVLDSDNVWRDLTNFQGADWVVRCEYGATLDEPVMTAKFTLVREQDVGASRISLAPQIATSPANRNAANAYVPLLNPGRAIRLLTATVAPGVSPAGNWKRVFDGKIDGVDPGGDAGTLVVRCRDLGAWLQDTWIEIKRNYGSDAGVPVQAVIQGIINDNAVPGAPVLTTPVDPGWMLKSYTQDTVSVMEGIRDLALQIGFDLRYQFLTDGDVDPVLDFSEPPRTKVDPDWIFGPDEYTAIPKAEITDDYVRNAVKVNYIDSASGNAASVTSVNSASIAAFKRRYMEVTESNTSNIDTAAEATRLADAIVADLGEPSISHTMETPYCWFLSINDLCRFLSNAVHYDDFQDLAAIGIQHVLEGGHGTTTLDCKGTPAGAYKIWLSFAGNGGPGVGIVASYEVVSFTDLQIVIRINGTVQGSSLLAPVELLWTGFNPPVTKLAGGDVGVWEPSGSTWTFTRPSPGSGNGACGFAASPTADVRNSAFITVPIPEATAFAGPTLSTPAIAVHPDPDDTFVITWTPGGAPSGATYKVYWRLDSGDPWHVVDVGTFTTETLTQSDHAHVIGPNDGSGGGSLRSFQSYVEMYDSGGGFLVQSAVGSAPWYDLGF